MRFALSRLAIFIIMLLPMPLMCQVNPHTNIKWPANCQTAGSVYTDAPNPTCVTITGTGLPVANPQFTGTLQGPTLTSSVNAVINVMAAPYNAKGDCVTDDATAIQAAQAAAEANPGGIATLYFPVPPGGCYLTSTIEWHGVSLLGNASGRSSGSTGANGTITIRGKPGLDILHVPDPTTSTGFPWHQSWRIENIIFQLDNTVNGNFPHRWPGRWVDDGVMTAGSPVLASGAAMLSCNDIGQAIQVNGAGPSGANLVTTVQNVSPCWAMYNSGYQTVTLAANASTSVSNAHLYVSLLNLPVTKTVGNCAIAMDNVDGNSAHWTRSGATGSDAPILHNVSVWGLGWWNSGNGCAIMTQGTWSMYALDARNFTFRGLPFGFLSTGPELASFQMSGNGDFMKWNHGDFEHIVYPWITYNGGMTKLEDIEITADHGFVFSGYWNQWSDTEGGMIHIPEFESDGGTGHPGPFGLRIDYGEWDLSGTIFTNAASQTSLINALASVCMNCHAGLGTVKIGGGGNRFEFQDLAGNILDQGNYNRAIGKYNPAPYNNIYTQTPTERIPTKVGDETVGRISADFIRDGNYSVAYSQNNLFFWPHELLISDTRGPGVWESYVQSDSASPTGKYMVLSPIKHPRQFQQNWGPVVNGFIRVGQIIPAAPATLVINAKCPSGTTTATLAAGVDTTTVLWTKAITCTTSYAVYTMNADLTSQSGHDVWFGTTDNAINAAWLAIRPSQADVNGKVIADGVLTLSSATTAQATFATAYAATPICMWEPRFNPGTASHWDTSSTTQAQITFSAAVSGSVAYFCITQ